MKYELKSISPTGIPQAIAKAERYRYLAQPEEAESICRDILAVDPENQAGWRLLGLCITDQFTGDVTDRYNEAEEAFKKLAGFAVQSLNERKSYDISASYTDTFHAAMAAPRF